MFHLIGCFYVLPKNQSQFWMAGLDATLVTVFISVRSFRDQGPLIGGRGGEITFCGKYNKVSKIHFHTFPIKFISNFKENTPLPPSVGEAGAAPLPHFGNCAAGTVRSSQGRNFAVTSVIYKAIPTLKETKTFTVLKSKSQKSQNREQHVAWKRN